MKLRWTRLALQDLRHLHEYIAEENPLAASRMVVRIQDATQRLTKHPQMGRPGRVQGTRELIIADHPTSWFTFCEILKSRLWPLFIAPCVGPTLSVRKTPET